MEKLNVVGPQIRRFRVSDGLEQEDLAARCGILGWSVSRGTVAKIESQVRRVTDGEIFVLAAALRRPIADFFPGNRKDIVAQLKQADTK